jgi:hypothetical protein
MVEEESFSVPLSFATLTRQAPWLSLLFALLCLGGCATFRAIILWIGAVFSKWVCIITLNICFFISCWNLLGQWFPTFFVSRNTWPQKSLSRNTQIFHILPYETKYNLILLILICHCSWDNLFQRILSVLTPCFWIKLAVMWI